MFRGKMILVVLLGVWLLCGVSLLAQANEVELTRAVIQAERQVIVAENLGLTEEEGKRFWPVYRDYRHDLAKIGDRLVKLIGIYEKSYQNLSEETAEWMINEFIAIDKERVEARARWTPRLREILSPKKTARFLQIENKLDAIVNYDLADSIPLVK